MSTMTETAVTTQVYRVYIKATPEAIWDAITKPEWNERYGYPGRGEYDLRPGGAYRARAGAEAQAMGMPELLVEGEVIEADPPRKLVQTWRAAWDPELVAEGFTRLTWEISEEDGGISQLTVSARARGRTEARGAGREHRPARPGRRRLDVDPERSQDPARVGQLAAGLSAETIGGPGARRGPGRSAERRRRPVSTS